MTRTGWVMATLILLGVAAFGSMLSVGGGTSRMQVERAVSRLIPPRAATPARPAPLAVPVLGVARAALRDSWGEARGGGTRAHHGTDIPAPGGTPVLAAAPGRVEKLFHSVAGGITLYERSVDGRWLYYYAHLSGYAPGVREGQPVRPGDRLGFVGDTGDAGPGNTHLHFGLSRLRSGDHWWQGQDVDPFPLLAGRAPPR